jgi:hypothetical protein
MTPDPVPHGAGPDLPDLLRDLLDGDAVGDGHDAGVRDVLAALRSPARPAELSRAAEVVDEMAVILAHQPVEEPTPMPSASRIRRLPRVAAIATVGLLGFGGVAAAATGTNPLRPLVSDETTIATDEVPSTTSTTSTTLDTTTTVTTTTLDDGTPEAPALPQTPDDVVCPQDVTNHGDAVSQVAHDDTTSGAEHGAAVSQMAQSDCGKTAELADEQADDEAPSPADPTGDVVCPDGVTNHGQAVSRVAKDHSHEGRDHGAAVSEMARSDCGK